jgi:hypothetical protein
MSENNKKVVFKFGTSFTSLLTVLFIGLKLTNYIDWSWWWVISPIWLPWALIFGVMGVMLLIGLLMSR